MNHWINKDTEIYCSFAETAGNTGCQMMNSAFYYYGLNKIYKSFSIDDIEEAVYSVRTLDIKGFAITMPYKVEVLKYVDECEVNVNEVGCANTVINDNNRLKAYNTDVYSATTVLNKTQWTSKAPQAKTVPLNVEWLIPKPENIANAPSYVSESGIISAQQQQEYANQAHDT